MQKCDIQDSRDKNPLQFLYLKGVFRPEILNSLVVECEDQGFQSATYVDGRTRDNVKTIFIQKKGAKKSKEVFDRIQALSAHAGKMLGISVWPGKMDSFQVARYMPGDFYGDHVDHDSSLRNLQYDRKLSFFVACSPGGCIIIEGELWRCNTGDAIIFPSTMHHAAPEQKEGSRYSFVAWIPGPNWK